MKRTIAILGIIVALFAAQGQVLGQDADVEIQRLKAENQKLQAERKALQEQTDMLRKELAAVSDQNKNLTDKVSRLETIQEKSQYDLKKLTVQCAELLKKLEKTAGTQPADTVAKTGAVVSGKTICAIMGVPGGLSGKPGKPIPPHPVGASTVQFSCNGKDYEVMSAKDGAYKITLPAGTYKIHFRRPGSAQWEPRNETDVKTIEVKGTEDITLDVAVLIMAVD